jgi:hypothetical protein
MSIRRKLLNVMAAHPKLVTFAIGLAITTSIAIAIGTVQEQQVYGHLPEAYGTRRFC